VLPGGLVNPDLLRADAVRIVHEFIASGRPVAAICHAPWLLIEAGAVDGRRMTSYKSIATDMKKRRCRLAGRERRG
jgi:protease I